MDTADLIPTDTIRALGKPLRTGAIYNLSISSRWNRMTKYNEMVKLGGRKTTKVHHVLAKINTNTHTHTHTGKHIYTLYHHPKGMYITAN